MRNDLRWLALIGLALASCGGTGTGADAGTDAGVPDAGPTQDAGPGDAGPDAGSDAGPADAGDTWSNYAQGFFSTYCTSCHTVGGPGDPTASTGLDFAQYAQVQANAPNIQCGVAATQLAAWGCSGSPAPEQFPICNATCSNPKPTVPDRTRLTAWISAGLPQ